MCPESPVVPGHSLGCAAPLVGGGIYVSDLGHLCAQELKGIHAHPWDFSAEESGQRSFLVLTQFRAWRVGLWKVRPFSDLWVYRPADGARDRGPSACSQERFLIVMHAGCRWELSDLSLGHVSQA